MLKFVDTQLSYGSHFQKAHVSSTWLMFDVPTIYTIIVGWFGLIFLVSWSIFQEMWEAEARKEAEAKVVRQPNQLPLAQQAMAKAPFPTEPPMAPTTPKAVPVGAMPRANFSWSNPTAKFGESWRNKLWSWWVN